MMIGRHVGHFYVIRSLGSGGMGVVYEAQDTRLPRAVALKFLKPALAKDLAAVRRFKREARLSSTLNHPNICTVLDVSEGDGEPFIAMELLQGSSVKVRLARAAMSLQELMTVALQVADALAAAHEQGILHRDLTPGNVFWTDNDVAKLLDFGLAKSFAVADDGDVLTDLTQTGTLVGTIHYMAPELFDFHAMADPRSDLYSLGAVIYQMATGARPFDGRARDDVIDLVRRQPHIPLRRLAPHHPPALEAIVDRLLAKRPDDRYQSANQLKVDLEALSHQTPGSKARGSHVSKMRRQAVAILPFRAIGEVPETDSDSGALAHDLAAALAQHPHVQVAASDWSLAADMTSLRDLGIRFEAATLVEGSVQYASGRMRVTVNLVEAATERPAAPALRINRDASTPPASKRADIAREIAAHIAAHVQRSANASSTADAEASAALKRGLHHWQERFTGGWRPAIDHFEYAIQRDPRFALAHLALGSVYEFLGSYSQMKPVLAFSVARQAIERALDIDDTLSAAHSELALIRFGGEWDWEGSEQSFRRALQLDPSNPVAHVCYSWLLMLLGRSDAALAEAKAGHDLAPHARFIISARASTLHLAKRYDEAIALCNECLRLDPSYALAIALRGQCYELTSQWDAAIADLELAAALTHHAPFYVGVLGHCYGRSGRRAEALALLDGLEQQRRETYVPPQCYVYIHAGLGDRVRALTYQEKAYEDGASPFNYFAPTIRDLYALDPQHKRRLEQMRLVL